MFTQRTSLGVGLGGEAGGRSRCGQDADGFAVDFFRGGVGAPVAPAWTDQCEARLRAAAKRALPDEPVYAWRDRPTEWGAQSHCQYVRPYLARRHRRRFPSPRLGRQDKRSGQIAVPHGLVKEPSIRRHESSGAPS